MGWLIAPKGAARWRLAGFVGAAARLVAFVCVVFFSPGAFAEERSLDLIFPELGADIKARLARERIFINADSGFRLNAAPEAGLPSLRPEPDAFKYLVETLIFIPEARNKTVTDVYNALKDVKTLEGRTYRSGTRNKDVVLFHEAARVAGEKKLKIMPEEGPVTEAPAQETRFMRFKDGTFGACYYSAQVRLWGRGIHFTLTNFKSISFLFIPVIKERDLLFNYYIEPLASGLMLYGLIGIRASAIADMYVDVPSAIVKRIGVINGWIIDGLRDK